MVATYLLSFGAALAAALLNAAFGLLLAWVLVRYNFPGRKLIDTLGGSSFRAAHRWWPGIAPDSSLFEERLARQRCWSRRVKVAFTIGCVCGARFYQSAFA